MPQPRLFILDANLKSDTGHFCGYDFRVARSARAQGIAPIIVSHIDTNIAMEDLLILPMFEQSCWEELCARPAENPYDHLAHSAAGLARRLVDIHHHFRFTGSDVLFFPNASIVTAMGLTQAAWQMAGDLPRSVLLYRMDLHDQGRLAGVGARAGSSLLSQSLADLFAAFDSFPLRLYTDSDDLTEEYSSGSRRQFATAPIPVDSAFCAERNREISNVATLLYIGDARTEKGYHLLPRIARELQPELSTGCIRMVIQSNYNVAGGEPGIPEARQELSQFPNVTLLPDSLREQQYIDCLLGADLLLLPYQAEHYVARTSGILAEAITAGMPALVPEGTWMSDQMRRYGAGATFAPLDLEAPARAARKIISVLPALREQAATKRSGFVSFHNPARLVQFVCGQDALQQGLAALRSREHGIDGCSSAFPEGGERCSSTLPICV